MRSCKVVELKVPMGKKKAELYIEQLRTEFGERLSVSFRGGHIFIKSVDESLSDYRVHDRVLEILEV